MPSKIECLTSLISPNKSLNAFDPLPITCISFLPPGNFFSKVCENVFNANASSADLDKF